MNNWLTSIKIPNLNESNFGDSLAQQFANIDLNFQKIAGLGLGEGKEGQSAAFIVVNLNTIFVYSTTDVNSSTKTSDMTSDWNSFNQMFGPDYNKFKEDEAVYNRWLEIKNQVEEDYQKYYALTGGTESQYAQLAAKLLWGYELAFTNSNIEPTKSSLTGVLYEKYKNSAESITIRLSNNKKIEYSGIWLYDWFRANNADKLNIFKNHIMNFDPGKLVMAVQPISSEQLFDASELKPIGSLSYIHIDPRYHNDYTTDILYNIQESYVNEQGDDEKEIYIEKWTNISDTSCVVYFSAGTNSFEVLEMFPQIYVDEDGSMYWIINGKKTKIPVSGPQGIAGKASQFVVVERVENVRGATADSPSGKELTIPTSNMQLVYSYINSGRSMAELPTYAMSDEEYKNIISQYTNVTEINGVRGISTLEAGKPWAQIEPAYGNNELKNTYRVLGIVGGQKFFVSDKDTYRSYDPAFNDDAKIDNSPNIQSFIQELDGAPCVVLPGPSFLPGRSSTTFWFSTLKLCKTLDDQYQLVVYCGAENMMNKDIDEHTHVGMMMNLDSYSHKRLADNRDKPRGLMLPIGSTRIKYNENIAPTALYGAHIISSDFAPFARVEGGMGKAAEPTAYAANTNNPLLNGRAIAGIQPGEDNQFNEVFGKRILHIGSVDDYRTLDYTPTDSWNPGMPGRQNGTANDSGNTKGYGTSGFWGTNKNDIFFGSELHIDEPFTVTRYRSTQDSKRWLGRIEGDLFIAPHVHINNPYSNGAPRKYHVREGGLIVGSTLSGEICKDENCKELIFSNEFFGDGIDFKARMPFTSYTNVTGSDKDLEQHMPRGNQDHNRGIYNNSPGKFYTQFSGLFNDGVGARVLVATDGIAIYDFDQEVVKGYDNRLIFSVNGGGDIQTLGREVRSNAPNTTWYLHTRWEDKISVFNDTKFYYDSTGQTSLIGGLSSVETFEVPDPSTIQFGSRSHTEFYKDLLLPKNCPDPDISAAEALYWRSANLVGTQHWDEQGGHEEFINLEKNLTADRLPMGWITDFGFANENNQFGSSYHGNRIANASDLPTILRLNADTIHNIGSMSVCGLSTLPILLKPFEDLADNYFNQFARFGIQSRHGIYISSEGARRTYGEVSDTDPDKVYRSTPYSIKYLPYEDPGSITDSRGTVSIDDAKDDGTYLFGYKSGSNKVVDNQIKTNIGLWVDSGAYFGESIISEKDMVIKGALSVGRQVRAKSFRRFSNSESEENNNWASTSSLRSKWAFLLDNGMSSYSAPAHESVEGDRPTTNPNFGANKQSPIVLDAGDAYGENRLIRFGYAKSVELDENNEPKLTLGGQDHNITLFGMMPVNYTHKNYSGYLFTSNRNAFTAQLTTCGNMCVLNMTISADVFTFFGNGHKHHTGGHYYERGMWGLGVDGSKDGRIVSCTKGDTNGSKNHGTFIANTRKAGISLNGTGMYALKSALKKISPQETIYCAVPGMYWMDSGHKNGSEGPISMGAIFSLDSAGEIKVSSWIGARYLFDYPHDFSVNFVWCPGSFNTVKYYNFGRSGTNNVSSITIYSKNGSNQFDDISLIEDLKSESNWGTTWKYLWYRKVTKNTNGSTTYGEWVLYEVYTQQTITYYKTTGYVTQYDADGDPVYKPSTTPAPTNITSQVQSIMDNNEDYDDSMLKSLVTGPGLQYIWEKTVTKTVENTTETWRLMYTNDMALASELDFEIEPDESSTPVILFSGSIYKDAAPGSAWKLLDGTFCKHPGVKDLSLAHFDEGALQIKVNPNNGYTVTPFSVTGLSVWAEGVFRAWDRNTFKNYLDDGGWWCTGGVDHNQKLVYINAWKKRDSGNKVSNIESFHAIREFNVTIIGTVQSPE